VPTETTVKLGKGKRGVEDAVSYAVGHRIRIEVLALLNEGCHTQDELAKKLRLPLSTIGHHIKALLDDGSIELAQTEMVRGTLRHYYRAVEMPFYDDDEIAAMPPEARQATAGVIMQAVMAEMMAAFWAGKMIDDRRVWLAWRWFNLDATGRDDLADEQARSWARIQQIEAESIERCNESGEPAISYIVTSLGFERCRTAPPAPMGLQRNPN